MREQVTSVIINVMVLQIKLASSIPEECRI